MESKDGDNFERRWGLASLEISSENIQTQYPLDSPSGIPVGWRHDLSFHNPIGRVKSMEIEGEELIGTIMLSAAEVAAVMPGGVEDLRKGLNNGISIGFFATSLLQIDTQDGTQENPDIMAYEESSIYEAS